MNQWKLIGKFIKYSVVGIVGFGALFVWMVSAGFDPTEGLESKPIVLEEIVVEDNSMKKERQEKMLMAIQTQGVKNCVKTLGDGVYSHRSTEWKVKACNGKTIEN